MLTNCVLCAAEYHVSPAGIDGNEGSASKPFKTISAAAAIAKPGDTITVHEGIYRERVNPPRGGTSDTNRITYQAAPGEKVRITGAEIVTGWEDLGSGLWRADIDRDFFGSFNPFADVISGHWYRAEDRINHSGTVYINGEWLEEAAAEQDVRGTVSESGPLWWAEVNETSGKTRVLVQYKGADLNKELVEVNARQTVFYPGRKGVDYITVRGFELCQAATPWAPPTTQQIGLIGPNWAKGWVIENNDIHHSICSGITLGMGDFGQDVAGSAQGTIKVLKYLQENNLWSKDTIGGHLIRNNRIYKCEQAGLNGNCGGAFSTIVGNEIFDISIFGNLKGPEVGGIKFHAPIDARIIGNCIHNAGGRSLWVDWQGQGAILERNLIFDARGAGLYLEVNHGALTVANNIVMNYAQNRSHGMAYAHNLFAERFLLVDTTRVIPYQVPHSTKIAGYFGGFDVPGDDRLYNNIFASNKKPDTFSYVPKGMPSYFGGNAYLRGMTPPPEEPNPVVITDPVPEPRIVKKADGYYLEWTANTDWEGGVIRKPVTSDLLGTAKVPVQRWENPDGSDLVINKDYFGNPRDASNPVPGPFASLKEGLMSVKVWPNPVDEADYMQQR
jgi:alpha-N-arabinofuranosidase